MMPPVEIAANNISRVSVTLLPVRVIIAKSEAISRVFVDRAACRADANHIDNRDACLHQANAGEMLG
jgi:hypothetical protein